MSFLQAPEAPKVGMANGVGVNPQAGGVVPVGVGAGAVVGGPNSNNPGVSNPKDSPLAALSSKLQAANEGIWFRVGSLGELMHDYDRAIQAYENVLRHNPANVKALTQIASIHRIREQYNKAVEYFQRILQIDNNNGEVWGALGHCYLMLEDLQKAYASYQQALYHLPNPKDPNLWYGIGILYDRYGSYEHAEESFTAVLKMDPKFEKANEILFRLAIIYKQQMKYDQSLEFFHQILPTPPRPLLQADIWFQIGHVYELRKEFALAKEAYERVLKETPNHAKVLQQLGWLHYNNPQLGGVDVAVGYLMKSLESEPGDGQTWYVLGRCYMQQQKYRKAYDAYQQAVYRDGRNPTFWCSIGVLYYQINQFRDALDAYSRAIRLNPYLSEVWYNLGTLYESCNQVSDSLDAYNRAAELDPNNKHIQQRLVQLRQQLTMGGTPSDAKEIPAINLSDTNTMEVSDKEKKLPSVGKESGPGEHFPTREVESGGMLPIPAGAPTTATGSSISALNDSNLPTNRGIPGMQHLISEKEGG